MKVNVVGASIAGLASALELLSLDSNFDVTIYDKKQYVGANIVCGGAISAFMLRELRLNIPDNFVAATVNHVRLYSPNNNYWELKSREIYGYVLHRGMYELELSRRIAEKGGKFKLGNGFTRFEDKNAYYIAADGIAGNTRKLLGLRQPQNNDIHLGVQKLAYLQHPKNRMDLYFGSEYAPEGYAWIFPEGNNRVRIGLGTPLSIKKNTSKLLTKFMDCVGAEPLSKITAKLIPTAAPSKLIIDNVLLVGDAGLLCDPSTGGGIANAIMSGRMAAKALHERNPKRYPRYLRGLKRRNNMRYKIKEMLAAMTDEDYNDLVAAMKDFHPNLTRISWALFHALFEVAIKNPKMFTRHKVLRRLLNRNTFMGAY